MSDESDEDPFEPDDSDMERLVEQRRAKFSTLFRHNIDDIFETAKEIKAFHDEYNENPRIWRASWSVVCLHVVGITDGACSQYETVHTVFSSPMLAGYEDIWPERIYTLYLIARAYEIHDRTVHKALDAGTISRAMLQEDAKQLKGLAEQEAQVKGPDYLYGERKKPKRAKPKTWRKNEPKEEPENADGSLDDPLSMASIKAEITEDMRIEESEKCLLTLTQDIETYGAAVEANVLRQILMGRVAHPRFFQIIHFWDTAHHQIAVTMALSKLGYR